MKSKSPRIIVFQPTLFTDLMGPMCNSCSPAGCIYKPLPDPLDYTADWIKSGVGVPDPHSGILPSLVTVDITDFLSGPGKY